MRETEQRFHEIIAWYSYHKKSTKVMSLPKKVELMDKMIDNMFTLMTMMYRDQRIAEAGRKQQRIALPPNMSMKTGGIPQVIPIRKKH